MAITSVFYPVGMIKNQKRWLVIILKLLCIAATQMIAHYSINFDLIHKTFTLLVFNSCVVSGKIFQAIASVVVLVVMAKIANSF